MQSFTHSEGWETQNGIMVHRTSIRTRAISQIIQAELSLRIYITYYPGHYWKALQHRVGLVRTTSLKSFSTNLITKEEYGKENFCFK